VGTGPFTLDSYAPGDKLIVKKNPGYWLKDASGTALPYLDEIEFRVIPDSQVRATALESGDVDLISTSDGAVISDFDGNTDYNLILQQDFAETNYILLHLSKAGPLQSREVRCALLQAIDKVDIIDVIANGYLDPANGPFSPGQEGYLDDNGSLPYDPDAAAAAIETYEAANGPVTVNYSTTTAASSLATAQYLQDAWGQIGVDVTIDQIEQSKLINNALFGDPAFDAFGWRNHAGVFVDQQYFWWHSSAALPDGQLALNFGRLSDPVIDDLLEKSRSEADPDVRRGYAEDINRQFAKECWLIPTSFTKWGVISNLSVQGVGTTPQADGQGGVLRDGAGFPGQVWLTAVFKTA
jgi:peptide/nickel transport system substrate-binding protein